MPKVDKCGQGGREGVKNGTFVRTSFMDGPDRRSNTCGVDRRSNTCEVSNNRLYFCTPHIKIFDPHLHAVIFIVETAYVYKNVQ